MFEIYEDLWKHAEQIGRVPSTRGRRAIYVNERGTGGVSVFRPEASNGRPEIRIHNPDRAEDDPTALPVNDAHVLIKLLTLAHESGHATSSHTNADGAWADYRTAIDRRDGIQASVWTRNVAATAEDLARAVVAGIVADLAQRDRDLIWAEENRAWDLGKGLLRDRGFADWKSFDARRAVTLRSHAVKLGLEPFDLCALVPV